MAHVLPPCTTPTLDERVSRYVDLHFGAGALLLDVRDGRDGYCERTYSADGVVYVLALQRGRILGYEIG